jgi:hypothetical protein
MFLPVNKRYKGTFKDAAQMIENVMNKIEKELKVKGKKELSIAFLSDGPYGVPVKV